MRRREIRQLLIRIDSPRFVLLLAIVVVGMVAAGIVDLVLDDPDDWLSAHVVFEVGMIVAGLAVVTILWKGWRDAAWSLRRGERTARQHAIAVYRKAGLSGRAELAAFFLEDLLLPREDRETE